MKWERELQTAKTAAQLAGRAIMEIYEKAGKMQIEYKEDHTPLTEADKAANKIITDILRREFPKYGLLSEEEKDSRERLTNPYCFIVDPLDGTKEFIKRNGQFTVNIALAYENRSVMGVIYVPVTGEMYYASEGEGAYYMSHEGIEPMKLHVSERTENLRLVMSSSHGCEQMERFLKEHPFAEIVKVGSSLKGCMVACGKADVYYRFNPTMEWDTAAMQCIAEEAGAVFRAMDKTEMQYNRENSLNEKGFFVVNRKENVFV